MGMLITAGGLTCKLFQAMPNRINHSGILHFYKSADNAKNTDFGFSFGVRLEYNFCNYIGLVTGVNVSHKTFNTNLVVPKVTMVNGEEIINAKQVQNKVHIVEIPIGVRFRSDCCTKTCKCTGWTFTPVKYIGLNAITAYSSSQTYQNAGSESFVIKDNHSASFTVVPEVGLGIEMGLCERMKIIVMPLFRYDVIGVMSKQVKDIPANHKMALQTSLNFSF